MQWQGSEICSIVKKSDDGWCVSCCLYHQNYIQGTASPALFMNCITIYTAGAVNRASCTPNSASVLAEKGSDKPEFKIMANG